jgi:hypothetical protein
MVLQPGAGVKIWTLIVIIQQFLSSVVFKKNSNNIKSKVKGLHQVILEINNETIFQGIQSIGPGAKQFKNSKLRIILVLTKTNILFSNSSY